MRTLLAAGLIWLSGCAAGNYTLKGKNNAAPEPTPIVEDQEPNLAKEIFPWFTWIAIILICLWLLAKERKQTAEKTDS
jgi:hypothetical protein